MHCPYTIELIPNESSVLRQVVVSQTYKELGRRIPNETHFKPDPDGLSVHWDKYISVEDVYHLISISHNYKTPPSFKDYTSFLVFRFGVSGLREIDGISDVIHDPVYKGNPAPVGQPNNRAHALVKYEDDEEIRVLLCDWVRDNYNECFCEMDIKTLRNEIEALRERLDDTKFHRIDAA